MGSFHSYISYERCSPYVVVTLTTTMSSYGRSGSPEIPSELPIVNVPFAGPVIRPLPAKINLACNVAQRKDCEKAEQEKDKRDDAANSY